MIEFTNESLKVGNWLWESGKNNYKSYAVKCRQKYCLQARNLF
jgi:hypothetical protein